MKLCRMGRLATALIAGCLALPAHASYTGFAGESPEQALLKGEAEFDRGAGILATCALRSGITHENVQSISTPAEGTGRRGYFVERWSYAVLEIRDGTFVLEWYRADPEAPRLEEQVSFRFAVREEGLAIYDVVSFRNEMPSALPPVVEAELGQGGRKLVQDTVEKIVRALVVVQSWEQNYMKDAVIEKLEHRILPQTDDLCTLLEKSAVVSESFCYGRNQETSQ